MRVHGPIRFRQDGFGRWLCAVRLSEACFVGVWRVAGDRCGRNGAVVGGMLGVGETVWASDRAALRPPQARLAFGRKEKERGGGVTVTSASPSYEQQ